jgi:integrase
MGEVTVIHVEAMLDDMCAHGASAYVLRDVRIALSAMFADAVRARMLRANPAELAQLPETTNTPTRRTAPDTTDVKRLLHATKGTELGNLLTVLASTGTRVGEALAAEWADIDLTHGTWRVWRTVTRTRNGANRLGTSTKTGRERTIALPAPLLDVLRDQRAKVAAKRLAAPVWEPHLDLVFPNSVGQIWDSKAARAELHTTAPWWPGTFHVLRHWAASVAITDGTIPVATVSKLLGHATTRTTVDTYGHLMPESATAVSDAITRALR